MSDKWIEGSSKNIPSATLPVYETGEPAPSGGGGGGTTGLAQGGTTGQHLAKKTDADFDTEWVSKQHIITSTTDHTSTATAGKMLKADANGLPIDATNTDADVADAVTKKHSNSLDHARQHALDSGSDHTGTLPAASVAIPNGVGTPTYDDVQDYLNMCQGGGRLTGGVLTAHSPADGTLDISAMEGMIHTANTMGSPLIYFKKAAYSGLALTDNAVNFIWITYSGGTLTYSANAARPTDDYNVWVVGRCWRSGNDVEVVTTGQNIYNMWGRQHDRLLTKYGNMDHASGGIISAHATPLRLTCTGSKWYFGNTLIDLSAVTPTTFRVWYKSGSATWVESAELTLFSDIFNGAAATVYTSYQNGNSIGSLGANKYGVYWIFICPEGNLYVVLDAATHNNVGSAQAATTPASLPPYLVNWGILIGRVICQNAAAAFYSVESVFSTKFVASAVVDHDSLSNLTASASHTQYVAKATLTAKGDLLYASAAGTPAALADVAVGSYLASGGIGADPAYATLNQAAVAGLTIASSPRFTTVKLSGLTDKYIPYQMELSDILDDDCADISDWTDSDTSTAVSEVDPAGQFRFDTNLGAATNALAIRSRTIATPPNQFTLEIKTYFDSIGTLADSDYFFIMYETFTWRFYVIFASDGLFVVKVGGATTEVGTNIVKYGGTAAWQTWRFQVDKTAGEGSATVEVFLDGVSQGTVACDYDGLMLTGDFVQMGQRGNTTDNMVSHVEYIKIDTGLGEVPGILVDSIIKQEGTNITIAGGLQTVAFGCNGATPQAGYANAVWDEPGAGAFGADSAAHFAALVELVKDIQAALVANGILATPT